MKVTAVKIKLLLLLSLLLLPHSSAHSRSSDRDNTLLIFEGTVVEVGAQPSVSCGVMAVYQLAKYRVDRVLAGNYKDADIIVDHLACKRDVLSAISAGDKVIVVVHRRSSITQRWNVEGIRNSDDKVNVFYVAKRVARATSCCDAQ